MAKAPVKRKQKQKIKQKVKVSQNVKVVIGDIKKRRAPRRAGTKARGPVKPPMTINISNPQASNPYIQFFKDQITKAVKEATTMNQKNEQIEREETKASKLNLLGKLQEEPDDTARQMRLNADITRARIQQAQLEKEKQLKDAISSLKPVSERKIPVTPLRPRQPSPREQLMENIRTTVSPIKEEDEEEEQTDETEMIRELQAQRSRTEQAISKGGAGANDEDEPPVTTPIRIKTGPKPSSFESPSALGNRDEVLSYLKSKTEDELKRELKGKILKDYMKSLGLRTHERNSPNPRPVDEQRQAIIDMVNVYKKY